VELVFVEESEPIVENEQKRVVYFWWNGIGYCYLICFVYMLTVTLTLQRVGCSYNWFGHLANDSLLLEG
jgi:hypothetical protein